jgi:ABC-type multidrug transport system ATPase subunit
VYRGVTVVNHLDLRVERGEVYGFLGPNGAGKTTTIRMILGLARATEGTVDVFGVNALTQRTRALRRVGAVVEAPIFYENFTARQNLKYLSSLSGEISQSKMEEVLKLVDLADVGEKRVGAFSFGMKQRLGIAQALLPANELIFLDEPTNGLDPHGIKEMRDLLHRLSKEQGVTVFLSSHLLTEVERVCDRVGIIDHGKKILEDRTDTLLKTDSRTHLVIRTEEVERAQAALAEAGVAVEAVQKQRRSLEDLFVKLTTRS